MNPLNELILKWHHFLVIKRCRRKVLFDMGFRTQNRSGTSLVVEMFSLALKPGYIK